MPTNLHDEFVRLANRRCNTTDGNPRIQNRLATSHLATGFMRCVLEAAHHKWNDDVAFLVGHLVGNSQQHQHVVAFGYTEGI